MKVLPLTAAIGPGMRRPMLSGMSVSGSRMASMIDVGSEACSQALHHLVLREVDRLLKKIHGDKCGNDGIVVHVEIATG